MFLDVMANALKKWEIRSINIGKVKIKLSVFTYGMFILFYSYYLFLENPNEVTFKNVVTKKINK